MRAQKKRAQIIWALKGENLVGSPAGRTFLPFRGGVSQGWIAHRERARRTPANLSPAIHRKVGWPRRVITPPHLN